MRTSNIVASISVLAAVALTNNRFATNAGTVPAAGVYCPGVVNGSFDAGEQASLITHGNVLVEAGAAVAVDAAVQTDAQGRAITLAGGIGLGRALDAATAAGDLIRVKLA